MLDSPTRTQDDHRPRTGAHAQPESAISWTTIRAIFRRHLGLFLLFALLCPIGAAIAVWQTAPRYTATGTLVYEPSEYKARELQSIIRTDPITEAAMSTQAEILQSLHIAQKVAERRQLAGNPEFNPGLRPPPFWRRWLAPAPEQNKTALPGPNPDPNLDAMLLSVQAALRARPIRFSHAIEVTFTARDPLLAAAAVNDAMDVYIKDQFAAKGRLVRNATALLRKRAEELRRETRAAEDAIAAYRAQHLLFQGMHAGSDAEQISHLTEDLVRARGELAAAEAKLDATRGRAGAASLAAVAPSVVQLRTQRDHLTAQAQAQQSRLGPAHPAAEALRRQSEDAQRAVAAESTRVIAATEAERRAAADRVATLERNLRTARDEADRAAQAQTPLNAMLRDAEASRTELQAVLDRLQQTAQQGAVETAEAHEISQALPPGRPSAPNVVLDMAAGTAAGLLLGLVAVYVAHLMDQTLGSGAEITALIDLPCFALIPEIGRRARGPVPLEEYAIRRPLTAFAEQIRTLRVSLWLGAARPRVVAITAAQPGEGKTALTLSLGRAARAGSERVLLIECDLRQPKFARMMGAESQAGLVDLLRGDAVFEDILRTDPLTGLDFVPAGRVTSDVLDLFLSAAMRLLLEQVRDLYDLVLLDTPPLEALSEARAIAAAADCTLLCIRWRDTPRMVVRRTADQLRDSGAHLIGTVLTRVDPRAHVRSGYPDAGVYHPRYRPYFRG